MTVSITWSTTSDYTSTGGVVQEPIVMTLNSEIAPADPVCSSQKLYITNTGNETAKRCGFYISPFTEGINPTALSEFTTVMSWSADGSEYGVFTVQGVVQVSEYETDLCNYYDPLQQHTYTNGVAFHNVIPLRDADGDDGNELAPISDGGSQEVLYVLVKIPNGAAAASVQYLHHFYFEIDL